MSECFKTTAAQPSVMFWLVLANMSKLGIPTSQTAMQKNKDTLTKKKKKMTTKNNDLCCKNWLCSADTCLDSWLSDNGGFQLCRNGAR